MAYYAWSPIRYTDSEGKTQTIKVGDEVAESTVGKETFSDLIEAGSIRKKQFPKGVRTDESPRVAMLRDLNEQKAELDKGYHDIGETVDDQNDKKEKKPFWER